MRADRAVRAALATTWLALAPLPAFAADATVAAPAPAKPAAPQPAEPAFPDLTSHFIETSQLHGVHQIFNGALKRHGRLIYLEEESTSSGPVGYNEYQLYDFNKNILYRILRDEQIYFETPLTLQQRVDAIRKGWLPAAGVITVNKINITLSSRDIPLRPDTIDNRPVELALREITAEIPAVGKEPATTRRDYALVWRDPAYALPVKIAYSTIQNISVVEYRMITLETLKDDLFEVPAGFADLTPY